MTRIIETIIKENMICIAYWINAIIRPTCSSPWSMRTPPNHRMAMMVKLKISDVEGSIAAISRLTLIDVPVSSRLASSNRFSS